MLPTTYCKVFFLMKIFATSTYSNDIGCVEEDPLKKHSIKRLKGIAPKPNVVINLGEMNVAIELEGANHNRV